MSDDKEVKWDELSHEHQKCIRWPDHGPLRNDKTKFAMDRVEQGFSVMASYDELEEVKDLETITRSDIKAFPFDEKVDFLMRIDDWDRDKELLALRGSTYRSIQTPNGPVPGHSDPDFEYVVYEIGTYKPSSNTEKGKVQSDWLAHVFQLNIDDTNKTVTLPQGTPFHVLENKVFDIKYKDGELHKAIVTACIIIELSKR